MRLLKLPVEVQLALREELISMGHARALAGLDDPQQQIALLKKDRKERVVGASGRGAGAEDPAGKTPSGTMRTRSSPRATSGWSITWRSFLRRKSASKKNNKGGGKIVIGFESDADIEAFIGKFNEFKK